VVAIHRLSTENMVLSDYKLDIGDFCKITSEDIDDLIFN
jgi:hypothetical protein